MKSLCDVKNGETVSVLFIHGGQAAHHRLFELGILPGERIIMFHNSGAGPLTVRVKGSKLSLGHGLAQKIIVREG